MSAKKRKLVIIGAGGNGGILFHKFKDSDTTEVVGFAIERRFATITERFGVPVVAVEEMEKHFPAREHDVMVAMNFSGLNRDRERMFKAAKDKGYRFSNYVSPRACLEHGVVLGENVVILDHCTIQFNCRIGDNTIVWPGTTILHESVIGSHVTIGCNIIIAGKCRVGDYSVLGISCAVQETNDNRERLHRRGGRRGSARSARQCLHSAAENVHRRRRQPPALGKKKK